MMKEKQMSESLILVVLLTIVGGFFDAYTYACRDQVFANAQTGNIVRLGIMIADGNYLQVIRYSIPILAFIIGVYLTVGIRYHHDSSSFHWRQSILLVECIVVVIVSMIPIGKWNLLANVMISFICAMQAECFRKVQGSPFSSTMCTGNLRSATECFYQAVHGLNPSALAKCKQYGSIILSFIFGAILGTWLTHYLLEKAILLCLFPMIISFFMMFKKEVL